MAAALRNMIASCCGGGIFGAPPIAEQAPTCDLAVVPSSARSWSLIGTKVVSEPIKAPIRVVSENPTTGKPIYETPASAAPVGDHVPTTSMQSGANPGPIPPVGTVSPQAGSSVCTAAGAAPTSSWSGLALFAAAIILLWIFAGVSVRRLL